MLTREKMYNFIKINFFIICCVVCSLIVCKQCTASDNFEHIKYIVINKKNYTKSNGRTQQDISIIPAEEKNGKFIPLNDQSTITSSQIINTLAGAAVFFQKKYGADIICIIMYSQITPDHWGELKIGSLNYIYDGKGYNGMQNMKWDMAFTAKKGATSEIMRAAFLWSNLHKESKFNKSGTLDEEKLTKFICKEMRIKKLPDMYINLEDFPTEKLDAIPPLAPAND